jgi:ADP-dependent NAD(P)H-hydrate dehydratase / NAD(P)H-hydrate epimerase
MDVFTISEMLAQEKSVFRSGLTARALMEAAGEAMARRIEAVYPNAGDFLVLAGKGNNGGDGLVVARRLVESGRSVRVVLTAAEDALGELPQSRLTRLREADPGVSVLPWGKNFPFPGADTVVIDALLGVQAKGDLREPLASAVARLNAARASNFFRVVALDLPTGLAAFEDRAAAENRDCAVVADLTLAVGFAKKVLVRESLARWVGRIEVVPWSSEPSASGPLQISLESELAGLLPRRSALSHKNDFGRLAIVAGSPGFTGAAGLCTQAAQAMGAGLLCVVTRPETAAIVASQAPHEAMVSGWPDDGKIPEPVAGASAIAIGPGLGKDAKALQMLRAVLGLGCPVVIDADGLTVLAENMGLLREAKGPVLLTPHPGEMGRLIGRKFSPDERETVAREFVEKHQVTLVLKGTRTLVAAPGKPLIVNTTGNPGLSTGGSGDTLTGMLGALLAQKLSPFDAARLGVWLHGHAADLVLAERGCEEGITPTMLSAHLGAALVSLRRRAVVALGLLERAREFP